MSRLDISRLRKMAGMSQRTLADKLGVRQSFLSAIENGKSRVPEDKLERIKQMFGEEAVAHCMIAEEADGVDMSGHTHGEADTLTHLLQHIHEQAHQMSDTISSPQRHREAELEEHNSYLAKRNDQLSERLDLLREEIDELRKENLRLKELLVEHGIKTL